MATETIPNLAKRLAECSADLDSAAIVAELAGVQLGGDREATGTLDVLFREFRRASNCTGEIAQALKEQTASPDSSAPSPRPEPVAEDVRTRFLDICDRLNDRIRWSEGMLGTMIVDPDADQLLRNALGGVDGHIRGAREILQELDALRQEISGSHQLVEVRGRIVRVEDLERAVEHAKSGGAS